MSESPQTVAELLDRLDNIPPDRIRLRPTPGTATEQDAIDEWEKSRRLCELIEGTLVAKGTDIHDAVAAESLGMCMWRYLDGKDIGFCVGGTGMVRTAPGMVRLPDFAFISWTRLGSRRVPKVDILDFAPDLIVEGIGPRNSPAEMERKLREYFNAGTRLVWYVYPETRTVHVFTSPDEAVTVGINGTLNGGTVLPGFVLPVAQIFERLA